MNTANILALATHIRAGSPNVKFDMHNYACALAEHKCQSAACVAGWALHLGAPEAYTAWVAAEFSMEWPETVPHHSPREFAPKFLGLTAAQAEALFLPDTISINGERWSPYNATAEQAARVLDHLAATGQVDWSVALAIPA